MNVYVVYGVIVVCVVVVAAVVIAVIIMDSRKEPARRDAAIKEAYAKLKPYDPHAVCPKCGCDKVDTVHVPNGLGPFTLCGVTTILENMMRVCTRCQAKWHELPPTP